MKEIIPFSEYKKTLPLARKIYFALHGQSNTTQEVANSYNVVGKINRILISDK